MSTLLGVRGSTSPTLAKAADTIADYTGQASRYLTDGVTPYRVPRRGRERDR
jgi:hypothetical protein